MPTISREEISREVRNRIGRATHTAVLAYVTRARPKLWGTRKRPTHLEDNLLVCIFKDVSGMELESLEGHFSVASELATLSCTQRQSPASITRCLGSDPDKSGNQDVWDFNAEEMETNEATGGANLRMYSTDFAIRGEVQEEGKRPSPLLQVELLVQKISVHF